MSFFSEFKAFAMRGNVVDLAVGVVIGAAFGKIVSSLVDNVIMPPIGFLIGGIDFSDLVLTIGSPVMNDKGVVTGGGVVIKYGVFLNTCLQFVIIAIAIFLVVKLMNRLIRKEEAAPAPPGAEVLLLTEIRDILKSRPAA
jgi:large conductance mechanosensitive channel